MAWWVLPNWVIAVVLPGAGGAGEDQAPTGADRVPVEQGQPAPGMYHLPQRGGGDRGQPGVVIQPHFVVVQAVGLGQSGPGGFGQQVGRDRGGRGELPPTGQGRQLLVPVEVGGRQPPCGSWRGGGGLGRCHHRFCASVNGSKIPNGMTVAIGPSSSLVLSGLVSRVGGVVE